MFIKSQIRVSVSEDGDPDDIFNFGSSPTQSRTRSPQSRIKVKGPNQKQFHNFVDLQVNVTEDYILDEDKRFEEAAEKASVLLAFQKKYLGLNLI